MKKVSLVIALFLTLILTANAQWQRQDAKFSKARIGMFAMSIVDANTVWAIGMDTTYTSFSKDVVRTTNGGQTWTKTTLGATVVGNLTIGINAADANTAWVLTMDMTAFRSRVYKTTNGGTSWTQQSSANVASPVAMHFFDANNGVLIGDNDNNGFEIMRTTNGGTTWTAVAAANIPAVKGSEAATGNFAYFGNNIWFTTDEGRIYRSTDKGATWNVYNTTLSGIANVAFKDAQNGIMISYSGDMRKTVNGGQTWTNLTTTGPVHYTGLAYVPGTTGTYISAGFDSDRGSSISTNNGATWTALENTIDHTLVKFFSPTVGWSGGFTATATTGGVHKYVTSVTGISDDRLPLHVTTYPNPTQGNVTITLPADDAAAYDVVVRNVTGQVMLQSKTETGAATVNLNLSNQPKGLYIVEVSGNNRVAQEKITIQ